MDNIFQLIKEKLQEPKYETARELGKVITYNDFTKMIDELAKEEEQRNAEEGEF